MFSSCKPKVFAVRPDHTVRHIHYPVNPSSDHFHNDAVVPSSDHCRTETVLPPSDHDCIEKLTPSGEHCFNETEAPSLSLPLFPFIRGEVLPATFSPPHLLFFSTLLCLLSSSSSLPPLLSSSHLSLHSPPISVLASLVSSCPALVTLPLSSVVGHRPSFLRVQPTVICS